MCRAGFSASIKKRILNRYPVNQFGFYHGKSLRRRESWPVWSSAPILPACWSMRVQTSKIAMCKSLFASRQVNREPLKVSQRTISQGTLVGGTQNHAGRLACFQGFLPTRRAKAPPITGFQTGKSKFLLRKWKGRYRAIGNIRGIQVSSRHGPYDCPDPLLPYCSSRRDKTLS